MVDMIEKLASSTAWNHTAMPSRVLKKTGCENEAGGLFHQAVKTNTATL
jgi:hypothetical protein